MKAGTPPENDAPASPTRRRRTLLVVALVGALLMLLLVLRFGGRFLVLDDPLPEHSDVAIVLFGGEQSVSARLAGAMDLLRRGRVSKVMISVGAVRYYGAWLPDLVRQHVQGEYGRGSAENVIVCEGFAESTVEEMGVLEGCLRSEWRSVVIVSSNFHTRRARMIVDVTLARRSDVETFSYFGVADGSFRPDGWWRHRRYAET